MQAYPDHESYVVHDSVGASEYIADECQQILNKALERHVGIPLRGLGQKDELPLKNQNDCSRRG